MAHYQSDQRQLYFETHGKDSAEPVLLLHGLGQNHRAWRHQIPALSERYFVITPALRGFGPDADFAKSESLSIERWAKDVAALLNHLKIERAHIGGSSMGGAVGFQFALDYASYAHTLTVLNSQPSFELNRWYKKLMLWQRLWTVRCFGMERLIKRGANRNLPEASQAALREQLMAQHTRNVDAYRAAIKALAGWTVLNRVSELTLPILVMSGDHDYTSMTEKRALMSAATDVEFVDIKNSRHMSHWDQPQVVADVMLSFLKNHSLAI